MRYQSSTILALAIAAAATITAGVHGWSFGPSPSSSFFSAPLALLDEDPFPSSPSSMMSRMLDRQRQILERSMMIDRPLLSASTLSSALSSSPRYELIDDDEKFQLSIDVPGVDMDDLDVTVDEENGYLTVTGQRTVSSSTPPKSGEEKAASTVLSSRYYSQSKFSQTFALDDAVDLEKFSASLKNGVLVVTAPKDLKGLEETKDPIKRIPISVVASSTESIAPSTVDTKTEVTDAAGKDAKDASTNAQSAEVAKNEHVSVGGDEDGAVLDLDNDEQQPAVADSTENKKIHVQIHKEDSTVTSNEPTTTA